MTVTVTVTVTVMAMLMLMASQDRLAIYSSSQMKQLMAKASDALVHTLGAVIKMDLEAEVEEVLSMR